MTIMKLEHYHHDAEIKRAEALERWKERGYGYPIEGMFFFMLPDCMTRRKRGWVVKTETGAKFFLHIEDAGEEQRKLHNETIRI